MYHKFPVKISGLVNDSIYNNHIHTSGIGLAKTLSQQLLSKF